MILALRLLFFSRYVQLISKNVMNVEQSLLLASILRNCNVRLQPCNLRLGSLRLSFVDVSRNATGRHGNYSRLIKQETQLSLYKHRLQGPNYCDVPKSSQSGRFNNNKSRNRRRQWKELRLNLRFGQTVSGTLAEGDQTDNGTFTFGSETVSYP